MLARWHMRWKNASSKQITKILNDKLQFQRVPKMCVCCEKSAQTRYVELEMGL